MKLIDFLLAFGFGFGISIITNIFFLALVRIQRKLLTSVLSQLNVFLTILENGGKDGE